MQYRSIIYYENVQVKEINVTITNDLLRDIIHEIATHNSLIY